MQEALQKPLPVAGSSTPWSSLAALRFGGDVYSNSIAFAESADSKERATVSLSAPHATTGSVDAFVHNFQGQETTLPAISTDLTSFSSVDSLTSQGRSRASFVPEHAESEKLHVFAHGRQSELHLPTPEWLLLAKGATGAGPATGAAKAPTPSRVVAVQVKEGQEVALGQTLVVLEAMKTEIAIKAGASGTVAKVLVSDGQMVGLFIQLVESHTHSLLRSRRIRYL